MNQKQPLSGNRTKPRTLLKFVIPTAGLIPAFCSMLSLTTCSSGSDGIFKLLIILFPLYIRRKTIRMRDSGFK